VVNGRAPRSFRRRAHYIFTTRDNSTSSPPTRSIRGSKLGTLYTKEYFELVKSHLNPAASSRNGCALRSDSRRESEIATFFEAFPDGTIWSNDEHARATDVVLLARLGKRK